MRSGGAAKRERLSNPIERPPSIGLDERRMHVRAYNYWASLLGARLYPSLDDFDPAALDDLSQGSKFRSRVP